ncbi:MULTISPECIES: SDR family NAD(P)-dependent oxidoreductase [unclassified Pseudofrankia]|uniref:SDR family NAD(P)-dependent oxidoreductase n=1 Tax=unclassified Pseudofrankia TaxID=2994372 RepID=UPI0008D959BC|nr:MULTISPECIES: SDR family NAD(P)-dependent oxidoreductase [unclassified Pseudofrankia]MDT3440018.1 SDR family NAD(P)-dependent oxidoreductase [Pseudofrankia sp. BMG5.37]OHV57146.1 oxidoreductase [Pseudofrankia sp. BMG5.36]
MQRLAGKTAVVVGGGQRPGATIGNGRAVTVAFAREGARVLVVDRDLDAAEQTVAQVRAEGGDAFAYRADITEPEECEAILRAATEAFDRVDILHNNVGIVVAAATEATTVDDWNLGMAVNLTGLWLVCRQFLPVMRKQGHGVVLNVSSLASLLPGANPYSISKNGVNALTRGFALEYARHGVRVNAIIPGMIDTPIGVDRVVEATGRDRDEVAAGRAAQVPMGRQGSAWDIANAAVFLASDEASYITGAILPVDGGSSLQANAR